MLHVAVVIFFLFVLEKSPSRRNGLYAELKHVVYLIDAAAEGFSVLVQKIIKMGARPSRVACILSLEKTRKSCALN